MSPPPAPSTNTGKSATMPSLFSNQSIRSNSLQEPSSTSAINPYVRRGSATVQAFTRSLRKKSEIEIVLEGEESFIRTYSTFDQIKGHVEIKFEKDTLIGDMMISFEGQSQTYVEKIASATPTTGRTTGRHTFLRVQQPISFGTLPADNVAKANTPYSFPFTFIVPDRLLPQICSHKVENDSVRQAHLKLPPSIGDPMLSGEVNVLMDDLAPDMSRIAYSIRAKIGHADPTTGRLTRVEEKAARIRIVPAIEELPPLSIEENNRSFALRKEKNIRNGIFNIGKKVGRVTAEVTQPKSLHLPAISSDSKAPVTTMASVMLRFDPATEQEQPPSLHNLSTKLRVHTFYGAAAYKNMPEPFNCDSWSVSHGFYPQSVSLSSRNMGGVTWIKHDDARTKSTSSTGTGLTRRDSSGSDASSSSSASIPVASSAYDPSLPFYTAKVLVPVTLPQTSAESESKSALSRPNKRILFIPTFHSCIISRTYGLELSLSFNSAASSTLSGSSLTLRTPIQISQQGSSSPPTDTSLLDTITEEMYSNDEEIARLLDHQLNFSNPFDGSHTDSFNEIPEYEEIQTSSPTRRASVPVNNDESPPEYYSPFRSSGAGIPQPVRRVSILERSRALISRADTKVR